jgi:hypothetical protein
MRAKQCVPARLDRSHPIASSPGTSRSCTSTRTRSGGLSRAATTAAMPLSTASAANPELSRASHSCSVAESVPLADDAIGFDNIFHSRPGRGIVQRVRDLAQAVKARFESRAPRCLARTRRGTPCRAPTVAGKRRCRMHGGAAGSRAPKGKRNGKYHHGGFTLEAIDERRRLAALIRDSRDFLPRLR